MTPDGGWATAPRSSRLRIAAGRTVLLDASLLQSSACLQVAEGLLRVALSSSELEVTDDEPITLAFLQTGDQLPLDLLRRSWLHLEAITAVQLEDGALLPPLEGSSSLTDWTAALLLIRHLGDAEQRLRALLQLFTVRLGRRCGPWVELPIHLSHARIAELIGHTRVTVTRQLSKWRQEGLIETVPGRRGMLRLSPELARRAP
jgi:Crp-like helix-turn-helix domain